MKLPELIEARFVERPNRFSAVFDYGGRRVTAHVANSGRLGELLLPEHRMLLAPVTDRPDRKTAYDLVLVDIEGTMVSADARLPNHLVREAFEVGRLPELAGYDTMLGEVTVGHSRVDFVLSRDDGASCLVEVKSVTLVEDGVGLFPDSPTDRGRKHVHSLAEAVRRGQRAAVLFVIQREDVETFAPNRAADPKFCDALDQAIAAGVEVYARRCNVTRSRVDLADAVPVRLGGEAGVTA